MSFDEITVIVREFSLKGSSILAEVIVIESNACPFAMS
jgi:hypothetical protein